MNAGPEEKNLEVGSFTVQATRGLLRDRRSRRMMMAIIVVLALILMVSGSALMDSVLNPREHATRFLLFWAVCGWLTISVLLLAVFDLLMVRKEARRLQQKLRQNVAVPDDDGAPLTG